MTVAILRLGPNLIATVQAELRDDTATAFQQELLERIERNGARGVVIDISGLDIVDSYVAQVLVKTGKMARLMGAHTVLVGIRPEVAATLIQMGLQLDVPTALDLDEGIALLAKLETQRG